MCLRNISTYLPDYKASHSRRPNFKTPYELTFSLTSEGRIIVCKAESFFDFFN